MKNTINLISKRELEILSFRNVGFKMIELQSEEMLEQRAGEPFSLNNFASNAAPSEYHAINENKNKSEVIVKDVDTGIEGGKFRIMVTFE